MSEPTRAMQITAPARPNQTVGRLGRPAGR